MKLLKNSLFFSLELDFFQGMKIDGEQAKCLLVALTEVPKEAISLDTHDVYLSERDDIIIITFRGKDYPSKQGRGNLSSLPSYVVECSKGNAELVSKHFVR